MDIDVTTHLRKLIDHMKWADAAALGALRAASDAEARGHERALTLYAHVVGAEAVWLARIAGTAPDVAVWPALTIDEAASLSHRNARELDALEASLEAQDPARQIEYRNSAGQSFQSSIEDILLHVALHGSYHRGQIALLIRDGGGVPAPTDYIAFVRGAPAARTIPPHSVSKTPG
jgi:uncharacterized damage-inducible protein DinB